MGSKAIWVASLTLIFSVSWGNGFAQVHNEVPIMDSIEFAAVNILKSNLNVLSGWGKVHAAEYLLWTGHPEKIRSIFISQNGSLGNKSEYRIGIWRVLAASASSANEKEKWSNKIIDAFLDTLGKDRVHAIETMAKLKISPLEINPIITLEALESDDVILSLYTRWSICYSSNQLLISERTWLLAFLDQNTTSESEKRLAAYIIGKLGILPKNIWNDFVKRALIEPPLSSAKIPLLSAAYTTAPKVVEKSEDYLKIKKYFFELGSRGGVPGITELAIAMAERGKEDDIDILIALLNSETGMGESGYNDMQSALYFGIIAINNRLY